ncbi:anaerobic dehydrogenase, partial [Acinetobacter baumannii]|nr:anaerobic dehydrogenase [Acinetobacter baumannii]
VNDHCPASRCHLFLTDGKIQFLSDCHHELAGLTVDMVPIDV